MQSKNRDVVIHDLYEEVGGSSRRKCVLMFLLEVNPTANTRILNVGGTELETEIRGVVRS